MVNQSMSDVHDSDNCHLGPNDLPCDMCVAADKHEHEQRQRALKRLAEAGVFSSGEPSTSTDADKAALLDVVIQRARDDLNDGRPLTEMRHDGSSRLSPVERRIAQAIERDRQYASLTVIRAAVFDVLEAGYRFRNHAKPVPWLFFHDESDEQSEVRERFLDAVTARITELQAPPHNMDARLLAEVERVRKEKVDR